MLKGTVFDRHHKWYAYFYKKHTNITHLIYGSQNKKCDPETTV